MAEPPAAAPVGISQSVGELRLMVTLADSLDDRVEWLNALCAAVRAEAVAGERWEAFTRAAGLLQTEAAFQERQAAEHEFQRDARRFAIQRLRLCERILRDQAAGSVPVATPAGHVHGFALSGRCVCGAVATPEDDGDDEPLTHEEVVACLADARGEPDWVAPVATPTEPDEHERQHLDYGTWPCAWRGSAECPIVEELAGAASPVSAVQPSFCGHTDAEGCTGHGDF